MTSLIVYSTVFKLFEEISLYGARADEAAKVFSYLLKTSDLQLVRGNCFINYMFLSFFPKRIQVQANLRWVSLEYSRPVELSVLWLLSPCDLEDIGKERDLELT